MIQDIGWSHIITLVLGGGLVGGIVSLVKLPKERDQIIVAAAKEVVVIQRETLEDVREHMSALEQRLIEQARVSARQLAECHAERDELRGTLRVASARIDALEAEVDALRRQANRPRTVRSRREDE